MYRTYQSEDDAYVNDCQMLYVSTTLMKRIQMFLLVYTADITDRTVRNVLVDYKQRHRLACQSVDSSVHV